MPFTHTTNETTTESLVANSLTKICTAGVSPYALNHRFSTGYGTNKQRNQLVAAIATILISFLITSCTTAVLGADIWSPDYSVKSWRKVEAFQRYPLYEEAKSDFSAGIADADPFVRSAACLAIGRARDPKFVTALTRLLKDTAPITRSCAFWALLRMDTPLIQAPVLEVLSTWDKVPTLPGSQAILGRLGIPGDISSQHLSVRKQWVKEFLAAGGKFSFGALSNGFAWGDGSAVTTLCPQRSEIDAGEPVAMRLRVARSGGTETHHARLIDSSGDWFPFIRTGEALGPDDYGMYDYRLFFPNDLAQSVDKNSLQAVRAFKPNATVDINLAISTARKPPPPGIYFFHAFDADAPILIRIRRSPANEVQIPTLLRQLPAATAMEKLGEQRVEAAVPLLLKLIGQRVPHSILTRTLGLIGDIKAVPALLNLPGFIEGDVVSDATPALRLFGRSAYPIYEEYILNWREHLEQGEGNGVKMSLRLLGQAAPADISPQVRRVALEILNVAKSRPAQKEEKHAAVLQLAEVAMRLAALHYPEQVTDFLWEQRQDRETFHYWLSYLNDISPVVARPIATSLWRRLQKSPSNPEVALPNLLSLLSRSTPEILLQDETPLSFPEEARQVSQLALATRQSTPLVIIRVKDFLQRFDDPQVRLQLALLYYDSGQYLLADEQFRRSLTGLAAGSRVTAHYYLGETLLMQGEVERAEQQLRTALLLTEPSHGYNSIRISLTPETIQARIAVVESMPRSRVLRFIQYHAGTDPPGRYMEIQDGRAFYRDDLFAMQAWDPVKRQGAVIAQLPRPERDFMPLDRERVFVASVDGTAALYHEGKQKPLWQRPLPLSFDSYLTASPRAITAASEDGTLHVIDAQSGHTRWTRKVAPLPWPKQWWQSNRGLIQQAGEGVLLPDRIELPRNFEWAEITTGKSRWRFESPFPVVKLRMGSDAVFLAGAAGEIAKVSLAEGTLIWQQTVNRTVEYPVNELSLALDGEGKILYIAIRENVWALDPVTGRMLWNWRWQPLPGSDKMSTGRRVPSPKLVAVKGFVYCVTNWDADVSGYSERVDVSFLTSKGELLAQHASPPPMRFSNDYAHDVFASGSSLVFRKNSFWDVWSPVDSNDNPKHDNIKPN